MQKYKSAIFLLVLLCTFNSHIASAEPLLEEVLKSISSSGYRGVEFSSSLQEALNMLPKAKQNHTHAGTKEGIITVEVWDDKISDCVLLRFADKKLIEIQYVNFPVTVANKGGRRALNALAVNVYGNPTNRNGQKLTWDFPSIDRTIIISEVNGRWSQHVLHRSRRNSLTEYVATTAVPKRHRIHVSASQISPELTNIYQSSKRDHSATHRYWMNTSSHVRHNSGCRFYKNTKHGRACSANEGKPCGICGG